MDAAREGRRIVVRGTVQGVGFRPWVYRLATEQGLAGSVRNESQGVTIEAFGSPQALDAFQERLRQTPPPAARLREVRTETIPAAEGDAFVIVASRAGGAREVSIPPDLATCPACLAEVLDPRDRRHGYAFTNCTDCGPRFTIARDVPYDRAATSMAGFRMCPRCQAEYDDPASRRFHAQPNACPECGPRLSLSDAAGAPIAGDALEEAARRLCDGGIVAVKGLGGFHLACDATSEAAVLRLRARKRRDEKPFAVMVASLDEARALAGLDPVEERLLASMERPIVLVRRRPRAALCDAVAPGNPLVGILLAYTPLHHLLLARVGRPLVMTSGNLSDEPMASDDGEAAERLGAIADAFLGHDRAIASRCDDSVARVVAGAPMILRRARGFVPRPVRLARPVSRPVLACGAHLKNAVCLADGDLAWLGPHVGDLDTAESVRAFEDSVDRLQRFLGIRPEVIAHDLHPDYVSTRYAERRPEQCKVAVQHHHAHVAAAMAEHGLAGEVLGVAFDGTGYGGDGTAWGGEFLLATAARFTRVATLRPLRLAGGERAIRDVWRLALAALDDAADGWAPLDGLALFDAVPAPEVALVRQMLGRGFHAPLAHGAGRWFDAIGALLLPRARATYEGQAALHCNLLADDGERGAYPWDVTPGPVPQLDLRPMVRAVVADLRAGVAPATIAARFHGTLADGTAALVRDVLRVCGPRPIVLTGGCFANPLLAARLKAALAGLDVRLPSEVPPGDGGLALGQVVVADARVREEEGR